MRASLGALALLVCFSLASVSAQESGPRNITKFIAAEVVDWDYAPAGENLCKGANFTGLPALWTVDGLGTVYKKARFVEYTDDSFTVSLSLD